jgi:uroporphyrinogen-III synthase
VAGVVSVVLMPRVEVKTRQNGVTRGTDKPGVLSFESRRQSEMSTLILRNGGQPTVAASMQEVALGNNPEALLFVEALREGEIDTTVFLTGVGADCLAEAVATECPLDEFVSLLNRCTIVVRGPKPAAVLKKWGVRVDGRAVEPNTWVEVIGELDRLDAVSGKVVAVQEYGVPNTAFYKQIAERRGRVVGVPVYRWELPDNTGPLETAISGTIAGEFDLVLFTSAYQLHNVLVVAERMGVADEFKSAVAECLLGSVGPTATTALREAGFRVDVEPSRPKMGPLVRDALVAVIARIRPPSFPEEP